MIATNEPTPFGEAIMPNHISSYSGILQVSTMMRAKDSEKRSLLAFAAESTDEDTFGAVQGFLQRELSEEEVRRS